MCIRDRHNKATFVKNIISDNILPGDVYVRAKELHFVTDVPRSVYLVRQLDRSDVAALEVIQNLFPDRQRDFVLSVSETDIVVIKELTREERPEDIVAVAENIENAVRSELLAVSYTHLARQQRQQHRQIFAPGSRCRRNSPVF